MVDGIAMLCDGQFPQMKDLEVYGSPFESVRFPISFFNNLETLQFSDCDFKKVFCCDEDVGETTDAGTAPSRIRVLKLKSCTNLRHVWKKDSELGQILPNPETLEVSSCDDLRNFGSSWSSNFQNLTTLKLEECGKMINLVTPSVAQSLVQLTTMKISFCSKMKEIVANSEEDEATYEITFGKLKCLDLIYLENLESFCAGNHTFNFPSLEELILDDCPRLKVVCPELESLDLFSINIEKIWDFQQPPSSLYVQKLVWLTIKDCHNLKYLFPSFMIKHFVQLESLRISACKMMEEVICFTEGLTEEERMSHILFPELTSLYLEDLPKLTRFCYETQNEFPWLENLQLRNCPLLKTFMSKSETEYVEDVGDESKIDQRTKGNSLEVENSALFNEKVVFPSLKWLTIKGIRGCRKIWQDQFNVNSFWKLKNIRVESCEKLLNMFPFNMMERLKELGSLEVVNCDSLEEIFDPQGVIATQSLMVETKAKFVFPKVTNLQLVKLPKLKGFCSRIHATEWPFLKKLKLIECHKAGIFASERLCFGEIQIESSVEISNQKPLFWINESAFPMLEELILEPNNILKGTWHGQLSADCFRKLKALALVRLPEQSAAFPYFFIRSLPDVEKLGLVDASVSQIFQSEGLNDEERQALVLTRLRELRLYKLPELTHLWKEEFRAVFYNLRTLKVEECGKLNTLVPSLAHFENLTTLEISRCHGLFNLVACSAAKSLKLLERMSITDCKMIKEIIECEGEEIKGSIVFSKLEYLQLSCLPSLASFSSGDHIFEFPELEKVIVRDCPKMKIFSEGELSTPNLEGVLLTEDTKRRPWDEDEDEDEKIWQLEGIPWDEDEDEDEDEEEDEDEKIWRLDGNLNTTIQKIFKEMNAQSSGVVEINPQ